MPIAPGGQPPRVVEITHDFGRNKPRAGPGIGQDRGDARLDIGRGIGAELDVEDGSDGHGMTLAGIMGRLDRQHLRSR